MNLFLYIRGPSLLISISRWTHLIFFFLPLYDCMCAQERDSINHVVRIEKKMCLIFH